MDDIAGFQTVAPYLKSPLVLVGFGLFLFFGIHRVLLKSGIISVPPKDAGRLARIVLHYGFVIAIAVIMLGFVALYASGVTSGSIGGLVIDEERVGIPSTLVKSTDATAPVETDAYGKYDLAVRLPKGRTTTNVYFTKPGYASKSVNVAPPATLELELTKASKLDAAIASSLPSPTSGGPVTMPGPGVIDSCVKTQDMRALGWQSGDKGTFCRSKGFDGNWNPTAKGYRDYHDGGLCYKGSALACYKAVGCTTDSC